MLNYIILLTQLVSTNIFWFDCFLFSPCTLVYSFTYIVSSLMDNSMKRYPLIFLHRYLFTGRLIFELSTARAYIVNSTKKGKSAENYDISDLISSGFERKFTLQ
ncbi:hypothetical protein HanIR_Chr04g0165301 [Helianthus annuus]|nr:hypothetical protein HanIR_Chr04g0165301 [Helianthus annuus]